MSLIDLLIGVGKEFNIPSDEVTEKYITILQKIRQENPTQTYNWYENQAQIRLINYYKAYKGEKK